jgi:GDP-4-dehydro-6-deoxy-D-mannose reductase
MNGAGYEVWGVDIAPDNGTFAGHAYLVNDLSDPDEVRQLIEKAEPDAIVHLAAQSSVRQSFDEPRETLVSNTVPVLNLLGALRSGKPGIRLLAIGSADEYGRVAPEELPLTEEAAVNPESPYALAKSIQNQCCRGFVSLYGTNVVMTRSFNHIGPGQRDVFVLPAFARQITEIRMGLREPVIEVGNLNVRRDFTDVRDVCDAYVALIEKGRAGEVYNVCSGESHNVGDLLGQLCDLGECEVEIRVDPDRLRPVDVPDLRGDHGKITGETGWRPVIPIEETLQALLDDWSMRLKNRTNTNQQ